jgi:hypothetical protein
VTVPPAGTDDPFAAPEDQAVFSRGYVDKIRNEGARYRTEANSASEALRSYTDVFGAYPDEDRQVWFQLARDWAADPARAAAMMQQIAQGVLGDTTQPAQSEPDPFNLQGTPTAEQVAATMSPEQVQAMINDALTARDRSVAEQRAIDGVFAEVRAAGYDPDTAEGFAVLYNANHFTGGDIPKAIEMAKARDQKIIDDFVAGRTGRPLPSPNNGVAGASAPPEIKNIEDARHATEAFLRERRGAS